MKAGVHFTFAGFWTLWTGFTAMVTVFAVLESLGVIVLLNALILPIGIWRLLRNIHWGLTPHVGHG